MVKEGLYHIGFVVEQALGHVTHGQNLRDNVARDQSIVAHWALPAWETEGLAARVPLYKSNWTVRAGWRARRSLARIEKNTELHGLFFHTQVPAVLARDWLQRIPAIVSLDATPLQYDALGDYYDHEQGPEWLERLKWRLNRDCFRAAQHLVTWSAWAKRGLVDAYEVPADKVTVIPPGVDTAAWARPTQRMPHDGPVRILFVGGNLERKGGHLLLEVYRSLRREMLEAEKEPLPELHLVTRNTVTPEPGVTVYNNMAPNSQPLRELYHRCDLFCLPTYGDALPMVLSEAGAAGLPVISTWVAAIPEIVRAGQTGFLIAPGDGAALAAALRRLLENPTLRLRQGERAVEITRREFDAQHNAERVLALLKQIIRQTNGRR